MQHGKTAGNASRQAPSAFLSSIPFFFGLGGGGGCFSNLVLADFVFCMKVLRLWLERKTLPESIIRQHIRELDSVNEASFTSTFSFKIG